MGKDGLTALIGYSYDDDMSGESMQDQVYRNEAAMSESKRWTAPWGGRARLAPADILAGVWRAWPLMSLVFLIVLALGLAAATTLKRSYTANSSLLIRLGQAYIYNPQVGDAARGAAPPIDEVIQSETEILGSSALKERVINDIGVKRFSPKLAADYDHGDPARRREIMGQLIKGIQSGLKIQTTPDTPVVRLTFVAGDPELAAAVLNTLIDEYLSFRRTVLANRDAGVIGGQRRAFEARLADVDRAYRKFLTDNGVSDFDGERGALSQLYASLLTESYAVQAQLGETEARLGVTAGEAARAPSEIGLFHDLDHAAADRLTQLRIDRQNLLSRYLPNAGPVRAADEQIAKLQSAIAAGQASGPGARRVGVNPIYQTLQTDKNQLQAQAASLKGRRGVLAAELAQLATRRAHLAAVEPTYQDLARRRDALTAQVRSFLQREQESQAEQAVAQNGQDNVRIVERAYVPSRGVSLQRPAMAISVLFAAFTALCIGLLQALLARGFPTRTAAERTLELPALAVARWKPARAG